MERKILDKIKEYLSKAPRSQDKWHVSDLLYPLKAFWQRIDPQPMTDLQALYFIAGRAHHGILEACLGPEKEDKRADAGEFEKHGIYYSPDLRMPYPWEIKTSRAMFEPKDPATGYEGYLKQLHSYQAMDETDKGGLLVFYLTLKNGFKRLPALRFYQVMLDKKERAKKVAQMKALAKQLTEAVKKKDHKKLPLCPEWLCRDCVWFSKCEPWRLDKKRKNIQKEAA